MWGLDRDDWACTPHLHVHGVMDLRRNGEIKRLEGKMGCGYKYKYIYILYSSMYVYIYICVCVCIICMCVHVCYFCM
jgi:hypothetical protein